jgi:putative transposase
MTTINIKPGEIFDLPDGRFRFLEEWEDETLWFISSRNKRFPMTQAELTGMMGVGLAKRVDLFKRSDGVPKSVNDLGPFRPARSGARRRCGRARSSSTSANGDKVGGSLGREGLRKFIAGLNGARPALLTHVVNASALYNAIKNCGEPGNRPLHVFRSLRGKTERKRFKKAVEEAFDEAVDFYWSLRSRTYSDAYAHFRTMMKDAAVDPKFFPRRMETLRRRIRRTISKDNWARKYSLREALFKFEGVKDSLSATEPLELVIMDHTVIDTFVVFDNEFFPAARQADPHRRHRRRHAGHPRIPDLLRAGQPLLRPDDAQARQPR